MAKAIIESVGLPWGGVKLNRQQRISILFNILFWSFYCTTEFSIVLGPVEQVSLLTPSCWLPIFKKLTSKDWNMEIACCAGSLKTCMSF